VKAAIAALAVGWLVWVGGAAILGVAAAHDSANLNSATACPIPNHPKHYGIASWQWWPPGEVCAGPKGHVFSRPQSWRSKIAIGLGVGLVVLPTGTAILGRRMRNRAETRSGSMDLEDIVHLVDEDAGRATGPQS